MHRLEAMKETLMNCVQGQLGDLASVDAKELGEAVDMIKDLSEAIYYCTIVKSMEGKDKEHYERDMDRDRGRMYYGPISTTYIPDMRDAKEGRSPITRKMYMEHKDMHAPRETQMQELDKYMQELTHDLTEMIEDSSAEEKQMLQKKLTALASKIV